MNFRVTCQRNGSDDAGKPYAVFRRPGPRRPGLRTSTGWAELWLLPANRDEGEGPRPLRGVLQGAGLRCQGNRASESELVSSCGSATDFCVLSSRDYGECQPRPENGSGVLVSQGPRSWGGCALGASPALAPSPRRLFGAAEPLD